MLTPAAGLRAVLALAACAYLVWLSVLVLLPALPPARRPSTHVRIDIRPSDVGIHANGFRPAARAQGIDSSHAGERQAAGRDRDAPPNAEQGPGSAQWRAQQAGVEHLLALMAADGLQQPVLDLDAARRERAAFAPLGWVPAASDGADSAEERSGGEPEAAGEGRCALGQGLRQVLGSGEAKLAELSAAAAERLRVLRLDAAAALHWASLDLPTLDQPNPVVRR